MPQINPELRSSEPRLEIEMLDPSKVTLSRACDQCIKLKRKCNRDLPSCQRCAKKRSLCKYKNQPFYGSLSSSGSSKQINTSTHGSVVRARSFRNSMVGEKSNYYLPPCVLSNMSELNGVKINILSLDQQTFGSIFVYLRTFPEVFWKTRKTPFIHPHTYENVMPAPLQALHTICNIHTSSSKLNHLYGEAINTAVHDMLKIISSTHTFAVKLALAQSLLLLQIITLLFPAPSAVLRKHAENRMPLLHKVIQDLYKSMPETLPSSMSRYQSWLLAESCRRTLHIAHMLAVALPLDLNRAQIWENNQVSPDAEKGDIDWEKEFSAPTDLVSYRELIELWDSGKVREPTQFVEMLLIACKGADEIKSAIQVT